MKVSVIIPTLNEENGIGKILQGIQKTAIVDEVIVVDSSTDNTAKIAEGFGAKVIFEPRKGYGRALQSGLEEAKGDIVVYIDGDCTYDPQDIPRIVQLLSSGEYDVVIGDRIRGRMYAGAMNLLNRFGNTSLSLIFSIMFLKKVNDTQCGLRAMKQDFLEGLSCKDYGMPYATEQLIKLARKGARIANVPITYRPRIGKTKLCAWTDGFKILKVILKERFMGVKDENSISN